MRRIDADALLRKVSDMITKAEKANESDLRGERKIENSGFDILVCSFCGGAINVTKDDHYKHIFKFCPYCSRHMQGDDVDGNERNQTD